MGRIRLEWELMIQILNIILKNIGEIFILIRNFYIISIVFLRLRKFNKILIKIQVLELIKSNLNLLITLNIYFQKLILYISE